LWEKPQPGQRSVCRLCVRKSAGGLSPPTTA
jgi:hypothetical protein